MVNYWHRIDLLKREIIKDIKSEVKDGSVEVSILLCDPFDCVNPLVDVYEIRNDGAVAEQYEGAIEFSLWGVEELAVMLDEVLKEKRKMKGGKKC